MVYCVQLHTRVLLEDISWSVRRVLHTHKADRQQCFASGKTMRCSFNQPSKHSHQHASLENCPIWRVVH